MKSAWLKKTLLLLIVATSIAGCETVRSDEPQAPLTLAPAVRSYTPDEMRRAADELAAMPADSIVAGVMIPDYQRMRDQARRLSE